LGRGVRLHGCAGGASTLRLVDFRGCERLGSMRFIDSYLNARVTGGRTRARGKSLETLALAGMFAIITATPVLGADLVGHIANDAGQPAAGVQVSARNSSGVAAGSAVSDAEGSYEIRGLKPGAYTIAVKGQSVMSYLPEEGLTVNWGLSSTAPPIAIAKAGTSSTDTKASKPEPDMGR
jgi:Carboxypeptidase regulatory-like domain